MATTAAIEAGRIYWVTYEHARIQVQTLRPVLGAPGWWECESIDGRAPLIIPVNSDWSQDVCAMISGIKPGEMYWVDIDGRTVKVRAIEQSRELPHLWLCSDPAKGHLLVPDTSFHKVGDFKRETGD